MVDGTKGSAASGSDRDAAAALAPALVRRRLIPFLFLLYVVAYVDRINVGVAQLQMAPALHLDPAVYGLGTGIFFIGYFLFELPSNLILERVGARKWIARIMLTWGVVASCMMFVRGPATFYFTRFLLGVAEAGFFPGMILYLGYWFPAPERARAVAQFMTATAIAGLVGNPVSGALLSLGGMAGLAGWQWLFLLEGVPAIVLAFVVLWYLPDGPETARWLTPDQKGWLREWLRTDAEARRHQQSHTLKEALSHPRVWALCLVYFSMTSSMYGITFWLPRMVKGLSHGSNLLSSCLSAIPYLATAIIMVIIGVHSDRTGERRWHLSLPLASGVVGLVASAFLHSPVLGLASLTLATVGINGGLGPFWAFTGTFLQGTAAAAGIAIINSVGNLGGFVGPSVVGYISRLTGGFTGGLLFLGALLCCGAVTASLATKPRAGTEESRPTEDSHTLRATGP